MRKLSILLLLLTITTPVFAYDTGHSEEGVLKRIAMIEGRGFLNVLGLPAEFIRTPVEEARMHSRLWPVTMFPRIITNVFTRAVSAAYDIGLAPVVQPFTDNISPLTDVMGLPVYPWQMSESSY